MAIGNTFVALRNLRMVTDRYSSGMSIVDAKTGTGGLKCDPWKSGKGCKTKSEDKIASAMVEGHAFAIKIMNW